MATLPAIKQEQAVNERLALCLELSSNNSDGSHYKRRNDTSEDTEQVKACSTEKQEKVEPVEESHVEEPDFREESPAGWRYEDMSNEVQVTVAKQTKPATFFVRSLNREGSFDAPEGGRTRCRQFWRAGDYEGQPTEVRQQSGEAFSHSWRYTSCVLADLMAGFMSPRKCRRKFLTQILHTLSHRAFLMSWELMRLVGSDGSLSLPRLMNGVNFESDRYMVTTALRLWCWSRFIHTNTTRVWLFTSISKVYLPIISAK